MCDVTLVNSTNRKIRIGLGSLAPIDLNIGQSKTFRLNQRITASVADMTIIQNSISYSSYPSLSVDVSFNGCQITMNYDTFIISGCGKYVITNTDYKAKNKFTECSTCNLGIYI